MELTVLRYSSGKETTLGLLFINNKFAAYTLEDQYQKQKVYAETRIPSGRYQIKLRTYGKHHFRYKQKFPHLHKGMLQIMDVPEFSDILIHIGNTDDDTAGCLLVADTSVSNISHEGRILNSTLAYLRIYPFISKELTLGNNVSITFKDALL